MSETDTAVLDPVVDGETLPESGRHEEPSSTLPSATSRRWGEYRAGLERQRREST